MNQYAAERIAKLVPSHGSIIDIGCGDGRFAFQIAKCRPDVGVYGLDYAPQTIEKLNSFSLTEELKLAFMQGDAFDLPTDRQYDVVLNSSMLEYYPKQEDRMKLLTQQVVICKPGGTVIIGSTNRANIPHEILKLVQGREYRCFPELSLTPGELRQLVEDGGLKYLHGFGSFPEWGIERLDFVSPLLPALGRLLRPLRQAVDGATKNWVSDTFGYHVYVAAQRG